MQRTFSCNFDSVFESSNLIKLCIQWNRKELSTFILALVSQHHLSCPFWCFFLKVTIQPKRRGLSTVILGWFYLLKSELFESRSSMKVNRTFKYHFGCASTAKSKFASDCCFESRNSTKMERTLDCHFSFGATPKTKLSFLMIFLSHNSIKTKRTLNHHFGFTYKVKRTLSGNCHFAFTFPNTSLTVHFRAHLWRSQFKETEKDTSVILTSSVKTEAHQFIIVF